MGTDSRYQMINYSWNHQNPSTSIYYPTTTNMPQSNWSSKYYHHHHASAPKRFYHYRHLTSAGKSLKDGEDVKKEGETDTLWTEAQAAFLGPTLWGDKTLACESDLKGVGEYVDLDEFLSENGIPLEQPSPQQTMTPSPAEQNIIGDKNKRDRSMSPYEEVLSTSTGGPPSPSDSTISSSAAKDFDPRTRAFSDEELKPQPMIKKSRKQFVPEDLKDEKYWARRKKNNLAAKRSRDARRFKENAIAARASFLEKENSSLKQEVECLKKENAMLRGKVDSLTKPNGN